MNARIKTARSPKMGISTGVGILSRETCYSVRARRDSGYYWVKTQDGWQAAEYKHWDCNGYSGGNWFLVSNDMPYEDVDLIDIGEKITCPYE